MGTKKENTRKAPANAAAPKKSTITLPEADASVGDPTTPETSLPAATIAPAPNGAVAPSAKKKPVSKPRSAVIKAVKAVKAVEQAVVKPVKKAFAKKTAPAVSKAVTFSAEDIALKAYFISEHRQRHGIPGDAHNDWVEAEHQLREELAKKKSPPRKS